MECIHKMVVSEEPLKVLDFLDCSSAGFTEVDNIREGIDRQGLGSMIGGVGEGGVGEWKWIEEISGGGL